MKKRKISAKRVFALFRNSWKKILLFLRDRRPQIKLYMFFSILEKFFLIFRCFLGVFRKNIRLFLGAFFLCAAAARESLRGGEIES